jgi:galactarate dehydratase
MTEARPAPLYIKVHRAGNVAIVANDGCLDAGATFACGLTLVERVPQGHEVALADIPAGGAVNRYNVTIGYALDAIPAGAWINEFKLRMPSPPHHVPRRSKCKAT